MVPKIYLWAERVRIKGYRNPEIMGKAMAADGSMLAQRSFPSADWAKQALTTDPNAITGYGEAYPSGYELVWLDDHELSGEWWAAVFLGDRAYQITFTATFQGDPPFIEFRALGTRRVFGFVVSIPALRAFFISPGHRTPRGGDEFPPPAFTTLTAAMHEAHARFMKEPLRA